MARVSQITVDFEKRVNDGNYGSEKAMAQYVVVLEEGDDPDEVVRQVIQRARARAIGELKDSESLTVRLALNPPKRICPECGDPLADEDNGYHDACLTAHRERRDRERAEQQARWDAEREAQQLATAGRIRVLGQNGEDIEAEQDLGESDDDNPETPF